MKSLFKVTLLATTMAFALNATQVMAADAAKPAEAAKPADAAAAPSTGKFKTTTSKRLTHWAPLSAVTWTTL